MPMAVWFALKRSLHCRTGPSGVSEPSKSKPKARTGICGCSRSIPTLRDVVNGTGRRSSRRPPSCSSSPSPSPRSMASSDFMNPITHEVVFNDSKCEIKILGINHAGGKLRVRTPGPGSGSGFVGTLVPGTPGPRGQLSELMSGLDHHHRKSAVESPPMKSPTSAAASGCSRTFRRTKGSYSGVGSESSFSNSSSVLTCQKCGEDFKKLDAVEAHHLSQHAVTELTEGDSSRRIVEIICQASLLKSEPRSGQIDRVLKVHNMQRTLARFEEYREMVKIRASKLSKKHARCLADGNELLRFYGTVLACSLGAGLGSSGLCGLDNCGVCRILRRGFPSKKELNNSIGIFTASTSGKAIESIFIGKGDEYRSLRKALVVCRVIAGRVHKPLENFQEAAVNPAGFDSVVGKVGCFSNIEELYVLNRKALLPCFVVICRSDEPKLSVRT